MMKVMLLGEILVWSCLVIVMKVNGDDNAMFDHPVDTKRNFQASIDCLPTFVCDFQLKNIGDRPYSVLRKNTPLNKLSPSGLKVTRDGKTLEKSGVPVMKRENPFCHNFEVVAAGATVSNKFNVSSEYDTTIPGKYTVALDVYLEYMLGRVNCKNAPGKPLIPKQLEYHSSPAVTFQV